MDILWFKRDLRLLDHAPLQAAIDRGEPMLMLYVFEPSLIEQPHYSERHWRFVWESLMDLNARLAPHQARVQIAYEEVIPVMARLHQLDAIKVLYSYEETGIAKTYQRDKAVAKFCRERSIQWLEFPSNGVQRGLRHRRHWREDWYRTMHGPMLKPDLSRLVTYSSDQLADVLPAAAIPSAWQTPDSSFQLGGETPARDTLTSFVKTRAGQYFASISKPHESRQGCSRLSPYIAWGNLSMKQVYQTYLYRRDASPFKRSLDAFADRLRWHCHFIQKFEMEERIEFENLNRGYDLLPRTYKRALVEAWKSGQTGFPLVDASMRCLHHTGYLNFRMRAMLVSFLTHHLWQPWQAGAEHLASLFLDFEPGIHYPQFQMQSCTSGVNMIRIYNPVKQAQQQDPKGIFIREWIPELRHLPDAHIHDPASMTLLDQQFYHLKLGQDYPLPIVALEESARMARERLFQHHDHPMVRQENRRILRKHTLPVRDQM